MFNRDRAKEIVEGLADRVRNAVADFQLIHSVHPTALMMGTQLVAELCEAARLLDDNADKAGEKAHFGKCPVSTQTTFLGFPIITSRKDREMTVALLDLNFLKP